MTEAEFRAHVMALVEQTCGSTAALARKHKVHPKALTLFLSGARGPSADVASAFGFERRYVPLSTPAIRQDEPEGAGVPIPDGWALVPVDLTYHPAIREAGWKHVDTKLFHGLNAQLQAMWSAMLAASPRPAATDQAGEVA